MMEPKTTRYNAIIIGGGHNGLVTAAYLAKAGLKVLVLERRGTLGGAAATEPVFPGYQVNTGAYDAGLFLPEILADLQLEKYGLQFIENPVLLYAPGRDQRGLALWRDPKRTIDELARISPADANKYPAYLRWLGEMTEILKEILVLTPPPVPGFTPSRLYPWLRVGLKARRLGRRDLMEFMRVLPLPVSDFLNEWFESEQLKAALGAAGISGSLLGPRSPGTTVMLLYQALNAGQAGFRSSRFVVGGMGGLTQALARAAVEHGAELRCNAGVAQILLQDGRVNGVALENGEQLYARMVFSSADPRHTFFDLVGAVNLEVRMVREVKHIRLRGSLARLNLGLRGLPAFQGLVQNPDGSDAEALLGGIVLLCPGLEHLERAYDQAKYGRFSTQPVVELSIPSLLDHTQAPSGEHILSANIYYTPYDLQDGSWNEQSEALYETTLKTLEGYAPDIRQLVLHKQLLTPLDLERDFGLTHGDVHHGQMALDQMLFMRPLPALSQYRTPVGGLFLCGAGSHPGGGVTGAPGRNAAREALKEWRGRQ
jgi:phytoene dehydrogenase-like protein